MDKSSCVDLKKYKIVSFISQGSFGKVYQVQNIDTLEYCAAKISKIKINQLKKENESIIHLFREIKIMSSLDHPSIIKYIGYSPEDFKKKPYPAIVTEYATNGSLKDIISFEQSKRHQFWDPTKKLICIYGIASGMAYLHKNDVIHRDLKPENILMDEYLFPKIADFGLSKIAHFNPDDDISDSLKNDSIKRFKGTPLYSSPEVLDDDKYSKAGDVYAFAVIVYEIFHGKNEFCNLLALEIFKKVTSGMRPTISESVPKIYKSLIEKCWSQNPDDRPTFESIVEELKNESAFITDQIDKNVFHDYIDYIKNYNSTFDLMKKSIHINNILKPKKEIFSRLSVRKKNKKIVDIVEDDEENVNLDNTSPLVRDILIEDVNNQLNNSSEKKINDSVESNSDEFKTRKSQKNKKPIVFLSESEDIIQNTKKSHRKQSGFKFDSSSSYDDDDVNNKSILASSKKQHNDSFESDSEFNTNKKKSSRNNKNGIFLSDSEDMDQNANKSPKKHRAYIFDSSDDENKSSRRSNKKLQNLSSELKSSNKKSQNDDFIDEVQLTNFSKSGKIKLNRSQQKNTSISNSQKVIQTQSFINSNEKNPNNKKQVMNKFENRAESEFIENESDENNDEIKINKNNYGDNELINKDDDDKSDESEKEVNDTNEEESIDECVNKESKEENIIDDLNKKSEKDDVKKQLENEEEKIINNNKNRKESQVKINTNVNYSESENENDHTKKENQVITIDMRLFFNTKEKSKKTNVKNNDDDDEQIIKNKTEKQSSKIEDNEVQNQKKNEEKRKTSEKKLSSTSNKSQKLNINQTKDSVSLENQQQEENKIPNEKHEKNTKSSKQISKNSEEEVNNLNRKKKQKEMHDYSEDDNTIQSKTNKKPNQNENDYSDVDNYIVQEIKKTENGTQNHDKSMNLLLDEISDQEQKTDKTQKQTNEISEKDKEMNLNKKQINNQSEKLKQELNSKKDENENHIQHSGNLSNILEKDNDFLILKNKKQSSDLSNKKQEQNPGTRKDKNKTNENQKVLNTEEENKNYTEKRNKKKQTIELDTLKDKNNGEKTNKNHVEKENKKNKSNISLDKKITNKSKEENDQNRIQIPETSKNHKRSSDKTIQEEEDELNAVNQKGKHLKRAHSDQVIDKSSKRSHSKSQIKPCSLPPTKHKSKNKKGSILFQLNTNDDNPINTEITDIKNERNKPKRNKDESDQNYRKLDIKARKTNKNYEESIDEIEDNKKTKKTRNKSQPKTCKIHTVEIELSDDLTSSSSQTRTISKSKKTRSSNDIKPSSHQNLTDETAEKDIKNKNNMHHKTHHNRISIENKEINHPLYLDRKKVHHSQIITSENIGQGGELGINKQKVLHRNRTTGCIQKPKKLLSISTSFYFTDEKNQEAQTKKKSGLKRKKSRHIFDDDDDELEVKWNDFPLDMFDRTSDRQIMNELNRKFNLITVIDELKKIK